VRFLPLIRNRKWRFPVQIGQAFDDFMRDLPRVLLGDSETQVNALEQVAQVHPEGSLFLIAGAIHLVKVSGVGGGSQQVTMLEKSRDAFRNSLEHPGFLVRSDDMSWKGIFTTAMVLALVQRHEEELNTDYYLQASRKIPHTDITSFPHVRAFSVASLNAGDLEEADRWIRHWQTLQPDGVHKVTDAMWHRSVLEGRQNNWLAVKKNCEEILKLEPDHALAKNRLAEAIKRINDVLMPTKSE